jgi:hypothetical protein
VLELSCNIEYYDAMSRFAALVHVLAFTVGLLTGCTTLVTSYNTVRAEIMNAQEPKDDSHNYYGAFFISAPSVASRRPTEGSILRQYPEAKAGLAEECCRWSWRRKKVTLPNLPQSRSPTVISGGYPAQGAQ